MGCPRGRLVCEHWLFIQFSFFSLYAFLLFFSCSSFSCGDTFFLLSAIICFIFTLYSTFANFLFFFSVLVTTSALCFSSCRLLRQVLCLSLFRCFRSFSSSSVRSFFLQFFDRTMYLSRKSSYVPLSMW